MGKSAELALILSLVDEVSTTAKKIKGELAGMGKASKGLQLSLKDIAQAALGFSTVQGAFNLVTDAAKKWGETLIKVNSNMEQSKIAFTNLLGSAGAADTMLEDLQDFALQTPFAFPELVDATQRLMAMGFAAEDVIPIMTDVGNAASALGSGSEGINRITTALGQMRAAGKVTASDMRQLTEAGLPAWQMLAQHINKTTAETMDLSSKGQIAAETMIEAFRKFSQVNYGDMMAEQSRTLAGAWANLMDMMEQDLVDSPIYGFLRDFVVMLAEAKEAERKVTKESMDFMSQLELMHGAGLITDEMFQQFNDTMREYEENMAAAGIPTQGLGQLIAYARGQVEGFDAAIVDATADWNALVNAWMNIPPDMAERLRVKESDPAVADFLERQERYNYNQLSTAEKLAVVKQKIADIEAQGYATLVHRGEEFFGLKEEEATLTTQIADENERGAKAFGKQADEAARALNSLGSMAQSMALLHPAARAAADAVTGIQNAINGMNRALEDNQKRIRQEQRELAELQDVLTGLNDQLAEAQERLDELVHPQLAGMGEAGMQVEAIQAQLDRLKLAELMGLPLEEIMKLYPLLQEGAEEYLATLPQTEEELEALLEQLRLQYELTYEQQLAMLELAANPPAAEMTYEEALAGIALTKEEIAKLTEQIDLQELAIEAQQGAIERLSEAGERLNETLRQQQEQLQLARQHQDAVNEALQIAYDWLTEDRYKWLELGGEAAAQVGIIDAEALRLLEQVGAAGVGTTDTLDKAVEDFKLSSAAAVFEVHQGLKSIPEEIVTKHIIRTVYEGGGMPGRAAGGPVVAGQAYLVGERGPEVFVPQAAGDIYTTHNTYHQYTINANYRYQDERSMRDDLRLLQLLGAST